MQGSEKWGFVWWAIGDNAGRSVRAFFDYAGCPDFKVYLANYEGSWRCHNQGVPKGREGFPVISNARNPYARAVSYFLDISRESYRKGEGEIEDIKKWIINLVTHNIGFRYWNEWLQMETYPTYYIRVDSLEKDIKNIPLIIKNSKPEALESALDNNIRKDNYNERYQWLEHPEMKWQREYDENGQFMWRHFYDQELADIVYEKWEPAFTLQGFDKDSWK